MEAESQCCAVSKVAGLEQQQLKHVQFDDNVEVIPQGADETEDAEEHRWLSQDDIASFREDALRTVQLARAFEKGGEPLDEEQHCLRGLEQKMLKKPPPNFLRRVLRLQAKQRRMGSDPTTSLQLFSEACSKWARKRAVQLAAQDELDAYQIFMSGLRKQQQYDHDGDDSDDDDAYYEDEEFDFCTEGGFANDIYDYKHDPTEDETEFDDSDAYDIVVAVDKNGNGVEMDPFDMEDEDDLLTPVY